MLYYFLKILMKIALRLYFGHTERHRLDYIDNGRPTLILANHTNSFMDAIIMGAVLKRRIHFFARGDVFSNKWADRVLRSIGLLPVYRISEGRDNLHLNDTSNEEALRILQGGGAVLIFAEGASNMAKILKPLKKGPFRLAAYATDLEEPPLLAPLGINYTAPMKPFTNLYLQGGPPADTTDFKAADDTAQSKAALQMMRLTSEAMKPLAWHVSQISLAPLADGLLQLQQATRPSSSFVATTQVIGRINTLNVEESAAALATWEQWNVLMHTTGLNPEDFTEPPELIHYLFLGLAAIPAGAGWLFHSLPVRLSNWIADKKVQEPDFYSAVFLSSAVFLTLFWYLLFLIPGMLLGNWWMTLAGLACIALCGIFYLEIYRNYLVRVRGAVKRKWVSRKMPGQWKEIQTLYASLMHFIRDES